MSPSRIDEVQDYYPEPKTSYDVNLPYKSQSKDYELRVKERTEFPEYLPVWEEGIWHEDFPIFPYHDPALRADPTKPHLFTAGVKAKAVTPRMGTILTGVKLETLSIEAKDELALLMCERKFVILREQYDFLHAGPQFQVDFMEHFGKLSMQPVTGAIKGFPQFHVIHRDGNQDEIATFLKHKMSTTLWHHDVSYERQPPGYIMLGILACPDVGGDTVVADTVEAYKRLSPAFQGMISQVKAVHTSEKMIGYARAVNGTVRSSPIDSTHPVVRVHPVTGEKAIFLNKEFPKEFIGLKDQEAELVTKFLMDHMAMGHDFQARIHWEKHSVVMFDGRQTLRKFSVYGGCNLKY
jgi:sulfonate dioxygenase